MVLLFVLQLVDMGNSAVKLLIIIVFSPPVFLQMKMTENMFIFSCPGSTPLHLAARGGSLDCIRKLLAWGADRLQRDASGYGLVSFYVSRFLSYYPIKVLLFM